MAIPMTGSKPPEKPGWLTMQIKLAAMILALVVVVVVLFSTLMTRHQLRELDAGLERKARIYAALGAHELGPAVAFEDRQTAREVFESLSVDRDVVALGLFNGRGEALETRGELGLKHLPVA